MATHAYNASIWGQSQADPRHLLASQINKPVSFQFTERSCLEKIKWITIEKISSVLLCPPHAWVDTNTNLNMYTHTRYTQNTNNSNNNNILAARGWMMGLVYYDNNS